MHHLVLFKAFQKNQQKLFMLDSEIKHKIQYFSAGVHIVTAYLPRLCQLRMMKDIICLKNI